jgi:hypothetical protein
MVRAAPSILVSLAIACATDGGSDDDASWRTTSSMAGDTTVVRTTGVQEDAALRQLVAEWSIGTVEGDTPYSFGQISEVAIGPANDVFVYDRQPHSLRQYDSAGTFVRSIGREGQGPGEFSGSNGLRVHEDGRIALWDVGNRVLFFGSEGEPIVGTPVPGGGRFYTSGALLHDTAGNTYIRTKVADPPAGDDLQRTGRMFGITGLLRFGPDGKVRDSLRAPEIVLDAPRLIAQRDGGTSMNMVPFSAQFIWTFSPLGHFVSARTDQYAIDLAPPAGGGMRRIVMDAERVPVTAAEKSENEAVTTAGMRMTDPTWRWNGAPIPDVKPYIRAVSVANDGRIWVSLSRPAEEIPVDERAEPRTERGITVPPRTLREPTVYDVFQPDGWYLGRVAMPRRATWRAAGGDLVWAVTRDSLDVEQITRFRVTPGFRR